MFLTLSCVEKHGPSTVINVLYRLAVKRFKTEGAKTGLNVSRKTAKILVVNQQNRLNLCFTCDQELCFAIVEFHLVRYQPSLSHP